MDDFNKKVTNKPIQAILFVGATIIALLFLKLMFDISRSMHEMTGYMETMSQDVRDMNVSMRSMNDSMMRMEKSIDGMGQAFSQGGEQFKQWNPAGMMQQVLPGSNQRGR